MVKVSRHKSLFTQFTFNQNQFYKINFVHRITKHTRQGKVNTVVSHIFPTQSEARQVASTGSHSLNYTNTTKSLKLHLI